jgi:hypothetical protein
MFRRILKPTTIVLTAVFALGVLCARQSQAQCGTAECAPVINHNFGAAAAAFGQTMRVNVASYEGPDTFPPETVCGIIINYFGADGTQLVSPFSGTLKLGQTLFVDLNRNSLKAPVNRVVFRAVVSVIGDPNLLPDPCVDIRATVEVYDNLTGRTQVFIGDPHI